MAAKYADSSKQAHFIETALDTLKDADSFADYVDAIDVATILAGDGTRPRRAAAAAATSNQ